MASFTTKEMEASKLYECTFLQFEKQSLWTKFYHYEMRRLLNPYDASCLNEIKEINEKLYTIYKQSKKYRKEE